MEKRHRFALTAAIAATAATYAIANPSGWPIPEGPAPILFGADAARADPTNADTYLNDPTKFTTPNGITGWVEPPLPEPDHNTDSPHLQEAQAVQPPAGTGRTWPAGQVPQLNSRPDATRSLYIDVDGEHVTSGWVRALLNLDILDAAPLDFDGNPNSYNPTEQEIIVRIWEQTAEDFAPFDVNVTTVRPQGTDFTWDGEGDDRYTSHVIVTNTNWYYDVLGRRAGGVSLGGNIIGQTVANQWAAWVFINPNLPNANWGELVSHELGHTMGLAHDGQNTPSGRIDYYNGHGDWSPIMGTGGRFLSQWSHGDYTGATNTQDDIEILARWAPLAEDDHPNTRDRATPITPGDTTVALAGFHDTDVFTVTTSQSGLNVKLEPLHIRRGVTNLYAAVDIADHTGRHIRRVTSDAPHHPTYQTSWTVTEHVDVPAGRYTLTVAPIPYGYGPEDGFTNYANAGWYTLAVTDGNIAPPATPKPNLPKPPNNPTPTPTPNPNPTPTPDPPADNPNHPRPGNGVILTRPDRVYDSRETTRLEAGEQRRVPVAANAPLGATAAIVNVAVVNPDGPGHLSVSPCTPGPPTTSTVNHAAGQTVANTTIVELDHGHLCVYTHSPADIIVDLVGWLTPEARNGYAPIAPTRITDTRESGRLTGGTHLEIDVSSVAGTAPGIVANVTAVNPDGPGYLTVWGCDQNMPGTSNVNYTTGDVRAASAYVETRHGRICVYSHTDVDVVVDIAGTIRAGAARYQTIPQERVLDTRNSEPATAAETFGFEVAHDPRHLIVAASGNVTVTEHTNPGWARVWDCANTPATSNVNQLPGQTTANMAVFAVGNTGRSCAVMHAAGHLIVDVTGWWILPRP